MSFSKRTRLCTRGVVIQDRRIGSSVNRVINLNRHSTIVSVVNRRTKVLYVEPDLLSLWRRELDKLFLFQRVRGEMREELEKISARYRLNVEQSSGTVPKRQRAG
jgi:hypothetical protein